MRQYLFSYGTLRSPEVQMALFGRELVGAADALPGYRSVTIEIDDKRFVAGGASKIQSTAILSDNDEDAVAGIAFEISPEELLIADEYEPASYSRHQVVLKSGKTAWLYRSRGTIG